MFNDATLAQRIERLANGKDVRFRIDPHVLKLEIWRQGGEQDGAFIAYDIAEELKHVIPQNLELHRLLEAKIGDEDGNSKMIMVTAHMGNTSGIAISFTI